MTGHSGGSTPERPPSAEHHYTAEDGFFLVESSELLLLSTTTPQFFHLHIFSQFVAYTTFVVLITHHSSNVSHLFISFFSETSFFFSLT